MRHTTPIRLRIVEDDPLLRGRLKMLLDVGIRMGGIVMRRTGTRDLRLTKRCLTNP